MADIAPTQDPTVVAQKAKTVGDEKLNENIVEVTPEVNTDSVDAQVAQAREKDPSKVAVHETTVVTDVVITDPSSPLAVQIPDAGRGSLDLPIHALGGRTVEDVFADEASEQDDEDDAPASTETPASS